MRFACEAFCLYKIVKFCALFCNTVTFVCEKNFSSEIRGVVVSDLACSHWARVRFPVGELAGVEFRNLCLDIYLA